MLLSFQRPSHLFREGVFLPGARPDPAWLRGGPTSIALRIGVVAWATKSLRAVLVGAVKIAPER